MTPCEERIEKKQMIYTINWIRGRVVKASSLGSKGPVFDSSVKPSVVKIANHC